MQSSDCTKICYVTFNCVARGPSNVGGRGGVITGLFNDVFF